jgi:cysteine synthase A
MTVVEYTGGSTAVISGEEPGEHHVEGIGIGFIPPHLDRRYYDEVRAIDEGEARQMARALAREEGIFVGTSSGLNTVAAIQLAQELGLGKAVFTVGVDTGLKYLAGDLYSAGTTSG